MLTIRWDRAMHEISDVTSVPPAQVIIREKNEQMSRRALRDFWLKDGISQSDTVYEKVQMRKAVEISLKR